MKIALLYTVWTGDDMNMLDDSIKQHLPYVDEVHIWFQEVSNRGEMHSLSAAYRAKRVTASVKTTAFIWTPDLKLSTKENERLKHDVMVQRAKNLGFTHFIMAACDHFYDEKTIENGKKLMEFFNLDLTFTSMVTYYKTKSMALWPLEDYYMPFIHKIHPNTAISRTANYPVRVDPSVKVNTFGKNFLMTPEHGILHHYSMVRPDIAKKFRNAAASVNWSEDQVQKFIKEYENAKDGDAISYFQGRKLYRIENFPIKNLFLRKFV